MKMQTFLLTLLTIVLTSLSEAQIPRMLSYQGVLTDTLGNPRPDGILTFTFHLYETSTGGTPIWTEITDLQVRRGLFFTTLGDVTPFGAGVRFDRPYWLAVKPGSEPELSARIPLASVGYSFSSIKSDTAQYALTAPQQIYVDSARIAGTIPNNSVSTVKLQDGAVTSAKILDGTIQRVNVASSFKAPAADTADYARASVPGGAAGGDLTGSYPDPAITTGAVSTGKLADNAVTSAKILDGTIKRLDVAGDFKAPLADTADFARSAAADTTWGISGNNIYRLSGNVGIGTTSPQALLQLGGGTHGLGNSTTVLDIAYNDAGSHFIEIRNNNNWALMGNNGSQVVYGGSADVWISPGLVTAMALKPGGNVGIGTTSPSEKLEVVGNVKIGSATIRSGTGSPEGAVTGNVGDLYLRTDGSAGSTLYVKESGNGTNTGWIAK